MLSNRVKSYNMFLSDPDVVAVSGIATLSADQLLPETQRVMPVGVYGSDESGATFTAASESPDWIPEFAAAVRRLLALPSGWDSYGGSRIKPDAIRYALTILWGLNITSHQFPSIVPRSDGGIQLEWHTLSGDMEIVVHCDGTVEASRELVDKDDDWEAEHVTDYLDLRAELALVLGK